MEPLIHFISMDQLMIILELCDGEEGEFFKSKLKEIQETVNSMPKIYEQDGEGEDSICYLHYFAPGYDWHWYIFEKDCVLGEPQFQAFGLACMMENEMGYINLEEILKAKLRFGTHVELDLYWTPKTLRDIKKERNL